MQSITETDALTVDSSPGGVQVCFCNPFERPVKRMSAAETKPGGFDLGLDFLWLAHHILKKKMSLWAETPLDRAVFFYVFFLSKSRLSPPKLHSFSDCFPRKINY